MVARDLIAGVMRHSQKIIKKCLSINNPEKFKAISNGEGKKSERRGGRLGGGEGEGK